MQVQVIPEPAWKRRIQIEVPAEQVNREYEEIYRKFQRNATLPGFRKGKVPRSLIEASFGPRIEQEVVTRLVDEAYRNAIRENDIQPISYPEIDKLEFTRGAPMTIHAVVEVKPEVELRRYKGLKIRRPSAEVTPEDVDRAIQSLRERHAQLAPAGDRESKAGDFLVVDQTAIALDDGIQIPRGTGTDIVIPLDESSLREEFFQALVGVKVGAERETTIEFDPDDSEPAFAGRKVKFRFVVKEIKERRLPELDDDFASEVGDFENLEALREAVRRDLGLRLQAQVEQVLREQVVDRLIEENPFELPQSMVENYLDEVVERAAQRAQESQSFDPAEVREASRPAAERLLRKMLIFEAIQRAEELEVTTEELDERVERIAQANNFPVRKMRVSLEREGKLSRLRDDILEEKTFRFLLDMAEIEQAS